MSAGGLMITETAELSALRPRAVGTVVSTVFALASTAPAYSLAVTAGLLAALVGGWSALVLVVSAIPVTLVVLSFRELNAAEADCGTCFAWVTRAFGSVAGWLTGWVTIAAGVLVTTSLVQAAAIYAYTVVGASGLAESRPAQAALGLVLLGVMSYLAHRGITVAARTQLVLFGAELVALLAVIVAALLAEPLPISPVAGDGPETVETSALAAAALVTVFLYRGWDSSFSVNEESTDPTATPARSALLAMGVLVVLYAGFAVAVTAWAGVDRLAAIGEEDLFAELGTSLLGAPGGTLLAGAVLVSALASVQTTLLPAARSAFSMAHRHTLPTPLARVSHSGGPSVATWSLAALTGEEIGWNHARTAFVDRAGDEIRNAFKLYPWELMLDDRFGRLLLDRAESRPVTWFEPAWKALLSTKAILPVLWERNPGHPLLLPAYFDGPGDLPEWVAKPLHGKEGDNIRIHRAGMDEIAMPGDYGAEGWVYQAYTPLPEFGGNHVVLGSWIIDGEAAGMLVRESDGLVTDYFSRVVPHAISDAAVPAEEQTREWLVERTGRRRTPVLPGG